MTILEELYYGNLHFEEKIISEDPAYRPLNKKISALTEELKKRFSDDDFRSIEYVMDLIGESNSMHSSAAFTQGFRLGALMMVEVFAGKEGLVGERKGTV